MFRQKYIPSEPRFRSAKSVADTRLVKYLVKCRSKFISKKFTFFDGLLRNILLPELVIGNLSE